MRPMKQIYLDHASTTPVREEVVEAMVPYFSEKFGNPSSIYPLGQEASDAVAEAREVLAGVIGAKPREIFFTSGGTESDNWAIKGFARANAAKGKHIITSAIEHHAVLRTCQALEREGFEVTYLPVDEHGLVRMEDFKAAMRPDTILATIMFANNEIGTIEPIAELAAAAHEAGVVFHTDAVQAFGHEPIDVNEMGIDMLSASSHKIYGPKGVGLLYVRKGVKLENLIDGGQQERGKRGSTENVPGIIGFAEAAKLAQADLAPEHDRQLALRDHAIKRILAEIPAAKLNGSWESRLANNVNFSFEFIEGEGMLLQLAARGICVSSGSACTSGSLDPSHVLLAIGLPHEIAHGSLRMTIGRATTKEDVDFAIDSLKTTLANLRMMSPLYEDYQHGKVESVIANLKAAGFPYAS
ncbi:MAG: cysteine desulfurase NifS [Adlercreutzia sp.]|nr:cysteine desulfurase NifS [Adlercreutzia sp.]